MEITELKIFRVNEEKIKAYVTVTFDDAFVVRDVKVVDGPEGLFVSMPNKKLKDGKYRDIAHPKNQAARDYIQAKILEAYSKVDIQE